jgi:hypothetical protein
MSFIKSLNKYGDKISVSKTELYSQIQEVKSQLESMGLNVKIKNEYDLFDYEIIYKGLLLQNQIENTYEIFLSQHYDLLDYLNYEEKRKMFNNDIHPILDKAPHFYDEVSQTEIYIPYLESFVNQRYTHDFQLLLLKQHRDYLRNYKIQHNTPLTLYGKRIYHTDFSSLENVYEDERHICLYFQPLKTIYIFKKDNGDFINQLIIQDTHSHGDIFIDDVKQIAEYVETYQYKECLDFMKEKELICEKTYKKILKKYK